MESDEANRNLLSDDRVSRNNGNHLPQRNRENLKHEIEQKDVSKTSSFQADKPSNSQN